MAHFFKLYPSRICSVLLFAAYFPAILIVLILPIFVLAKAALAVLLLCCLVYYLRRDAWLLSASSPVAIRLDGDSILLSDCKGEEVRVQLLPDSLVTPALTILNVLPPGKKSARSVVIFPDSLDSERSRELRVLLKWAVGVEQR